MLWTDAVVNYGRLMHSTEIVRVNARRMCALVQVSVGPCMLQHCHGNVDALGVLWQCHGIGMMVP
jgi:hypothetical protein